MALSLIDTRADSFNRGYDAHEAGLPPDSYTDNDIEECFVDGWRTACHYAADGSYSLLCSEEYLVCSGHRTLQSDRYG